MFFGQEVITQIKFGDGNMLVRGGKQTEVMGKVEITRRNYKWKTMDVNRRMYLLQLFEALFNWCCNILNVVINSINNCALLGETNLVRNNRHLRKSGNWWWGREDDPNLVYHENRQIFHDLSKFVYRLDNLQKIKKKKKESSWCKLEI